MSKSAYVSNKEIQEKLCEKTSYEARAELRIKHPKSCIRVANYKERKLENLSKYYDDWLHFRPRDYNKSHVRPKYS